MKVSRSTQMNNRIGLIAPLSGERDILEVVESYGLASVQISCWDESLCTPKAGEGLSESSRRRGLEITSIWAGWPGPRVWDFRDGPATLGIVPKQYRKERVAALLKACEFTRAAGIPAMVTHLGFVPENYGDPLYNEVVDAVGEIAVRCKESGIEFWFETGQETPVTMKRLIENVGTGNLGINLDPANLILYGKANPIDSLAVFGEYVKSVHAKDGFYPTDPMNLGREVRVGTGAVDFPRFVQALETSGYSGAYIIEREIEGDEQTKDIRLTVSYLDDLLGSPGGMK